jgi:hypothetical protein
MARTKLATPSANYFRLGNAISFVMQNICNQ